MAKTAALVLLAALAGCETRTFTATRPDGTAIRYSRTTLLGESASEGVSVSKAGEDLTVDVGATGSKTDAEIAIEAFGIGVGVGRGQAGGN